MTSWRSVAVTWLLGCAALACACAAPPPPPAPPPRAPVVAQVPETDAGVVASDGAPSDDRVPEPAATPGSSSADELAERFVAAANAGDLEAAEALSTPECWSDECSSFTRQAQREFKARRTGAAKASGSRAVADADIMCTGDRKCDFVHLLLEQRPVAWLVADIKEDDRAASEWLASAGGPRGLGEPAGPVLTGGSVANASRVVAGMRAGFRRCFNAGLSADPNMSGAIRLTLKIGATGAVADAKATSTGTLSPALVQCIEARARAAQFDPPNGNSATLVIPINFASP
jgi:hypothetical protein